MIHVYRVRVGRAAKKWVNSRELGGSLKQDRPAIIFDQVAFRIDNITQFAATSTVITDFSIVNVFLKNYRYRYNFLC